MYDKQLEANWWIAITVVTLVFAGCSRGPETFKVNGKVTLDGEPVLDGAVMFSPADGSREVATAKVIEGVYTLECLPGEKLVMITGRATEEIPIPWSYVMPESGLTASVKEDGEIDFDLTSKPHRRRR